MVFAILALLAPATLVAQSAPSTAPDAATLAKYDKNGDGRLDETELAAMQADQAKAAAAVNRSGGTTSDSDTVQMSPFEVSSEGDKGYYASNTLSGTRINSKLEDLGASITVVTKQQMEDFALLDVNDIFLYEASTEGTGNYTDFVIDRNGAVQDRVASDPNNANRVRGIGAANQARGNFETSGRVPLDPSDIDGVEISRGPNSSIFGLGNASGTVNALPARANVQRETTGLDLRLDSYGGWRASIDINRPVIREKLAFRVSAVTQREEYQRKPSETRSKRYNGMVTWRPYPNTTIRGSFQLYENFARRPNSILPRDGITYWEQSGRPVWNAFTSTVTVNGVSRVVPFNSNQGNETTALGAGLQSGGSGLYARPSIFVNPDGTIGLWIVGRRSDRDPTTQAPTPDRQASNQRFVEAAPAPRGGPLWATSLSIVDQARYDWESVNLAAPNWSENRVRNYTLELEQFIFNTPRNLLALQVAWNREHADNYDRTFIGQGGSSPMLVYVDVNQTLPDGRANPYFLRPYINTGEPSAGENPLFADRYRGQLAYQLTLSRESNWKRWLGDHAISAYAELKDTTRIGYRYRDAIISDHSWLAPGSNRGNGAAAARGYYRYYIGDAEGADVDYAPPAFRTAHGTHDFTWYNADLASWVTEKATIGEAFSGGAPQRRNVVKTKGGVVQNHLLNGRIVTTFGIREDVNLNRESTNTALSGDGITADPRSNLTWNDPWLIREGKTKTSGVVVKPFRNWTRITDAAKQGGATGFLADTLDSLSLSYNESDSFLPSTVAQNLVGEMLPDPQGKGEDYGFALTFFEDKLSIRYNQYENVQINSRFGDSGTIATRAARVDFSNTSGGSDRFNLYRNAREWLIAADPTLATRPDDLLNAASAVMGFPPDQLARMNEFPIADTSDVTSKGKEIEVHFNPSRYIRSRVTVAQNQTIDSRLSPAIIRYINERMPIWTSIIDPRSNTPWFTTRYGNDTAENFLNGVVLAPYKLAVANEGKVKSQIREWRVNAFGSIDFPAFTENRILRRFSVNGALRWEDQASIGYYTLANDPNAFDGDRPIFDKAHLYVDAGISYTQRIHNDRIRMRLQLNVRNLGEDGRLQPVGALPNGVPHSYRIIDPQQFILTARFDL